MAELYSDLGEVNSNLTDTGQLSLVDILKNRKNIPNLDNIKTVGCYYYAGSTGISNRPFNADGYAFYLIAFGSGVDSRICQLAVETGGRIANRSCIGNRWSNWTYSVTNSDLAVAKVITDLHNIGTCCMFRYEAGAKNAPSDNYGGTGICICAMAGWETLIVIQYSQTQMYIAEKHDAAWSAWSGPK